MKSLLVMLIFAVTVTAFSGQIVALGETYLSVNEETGDVYRVRERSRAYCDGTVVTRFRARRISDCNGFRSFGEACDLGDSVSCSVEHPELQASCNDADASSCDRGPRRFRGVRVSRFSFSSCND